MTAVQWWGAVAALASVCTVMLGGFTWIVRAEVERNNMKLSGIMDNKIVAHSSAPHIVTLERAREMTAKAHEQDVEKRLQMERAMNSIIVRLVRLEENLDWQNKQLAKIRDNKTS